MSTPNTSTPGRTPARQSDPEGYVHRVIVTRPVRWRWAATAAAAGRGGAGGCRPHPADGRTRRDDVATARDAATQAACRDRAALRRRLHRGRGGRVLASGCRRDTPATARTATSSPVSRRAPDSTTSPPMLSATYLRRHSRPWGHRPRSAGRPFRDRPPRHDLLLRVGCRSRPRSAPPLPVDH